MTPRILFVDDEPHVLEGFKRSLRAQSSIWSMRFVGSADAALEVMEAISFDTVITDVRMPGKSGFELLETMLNRQATRDIPVIIVTGENEHDLKGRALNLGAADLLNKPVCTNDLIARIGSVLRVKAYQDQIRAQNALLEQRVEERTQELLDSQQSILWRLAKAGEYRDVETGNHVLRVSRYCQVISVALGIDRTFANMITQTSPLHDIGKIGIPDRILHKPGKLTPEEWEVMKQHCVIGAGILKADYAFFGADGFSAPEMPNPLLQMAANIALHHHEKWNGSGYPHGLSGEAIPLEARIVALADVYDALSCPRPYKPAFSEADVLSYMAAGIGEHFDPYAYSGLQHSLTAMRAIRFECADSNVSGWNKAA